MDKTEMRRVFDRLVSGLPSLYRTSAPIAWIFIWIAAIALAALVHLAYLVQWPDHFIHEDSGPYLDEARAILTGHYADDPAYRPAGVAFFVVLLSKLFSPNILVFVTAQHALSVVSAILIAATVRFSGAPRFCALLAFLLAALYARIIHYDNTVGAETLTVFLTSLSVFIASGIVFRKWPRLLSAVGLGLSVGAMLASRSAAVGPAVVILLWLALFIDARGIRRVGILALAGSIAAAVSVVPAAIHKAIGKPPGGNEARSVMAFAVGYSADFDHGVHLDRKSQARTLVAEKRAAEGPLGWPPADYQWPLDAMQLMRKPNESNEEFTRAIRDIFIETLTTPSTLWRHLTRCIREMYILLFDANEVAQRVTYPEGYAFTVQRDTFPIFHSPTGIKQGRLIYDHYSPPKALSWLLPSADKLQAALDTLLKFGYSPRDAPLGISTEYDFRPGPIRWLSSCTLILLLLLFVGDVAHRWGRLSPMPKNLVAGGCLMIPVAIVNATFPAFLVYSLHRYGYYVAPFMAGATGILGAVLFERIKLALGERGRKAPNATRIAAA
jgi:hypothetical protein